MNSISCIVKRVALIGLCGAAAAWAHAGSTPQTGAAPTWAAAPAPMAYTEITSQALPWPARPGVMDRRFSVTRWNATGAGLSFGVLGTSWMTPAGAESNAFTQWAPQLGVHWRGALTGRWQLQLSGWAGLASADAATPGAIDGSRWNRGAYTAQVEVQWQSARWRGLIPEFGAVGVQLQGGSRLMLRARHGGPMVYYRARF